MLVIGRRIIVGGRQRFPGEPQPRGPACAGRGLAPVPGRPRPVAAGARARGRRRPHLRRRGRARRAERQLREPLAVARRPRGELDRARPRARRPGCVARAPAVPPRRANPRPLPRPKIGDERSVDLNRSATASLRILPVSAGVGGKAPCSLRSRAVGPTRPACSAWHGRGADGPAVNVHGRRACAAPRPTQQLKPITGAATPTSDRRSPNPLWRPHIRDARMLGARSGPWHTGSRG